MLIVHALWIIWIVGGLFILRMKPLLRGLHLACILSTLYVQMRTGYCPLTDLEDHLLHLAGRSGYTGGFIEHYTAMFVYGDLVTLPPSAMTVGLIGITAVAMVLHLRKPRLDRTSGSRIILKSCRGIW